MFNLLVSGGGWGQHEGSMPSARIFEHTDEDIIRAHRGEHGPNFAKLREYPCLFMPEVGGEDRFAHVGYLRRVTGGRNVDIAYALDRDFPPISLDMLQAVAADLRMDGFEFHRTHWAVKNVNLFEVLLKAMKPVYNKPTVFQVSDPPQIDPEQISVMMPFDAGFAGVYASLQNVGQALAMKVNRADDIWQHHQIIQDVVSLIDRSAIVIADCTNRNSNVFYEIGIAHALGREVILITQNMEFIPFDLRHLRVVTYLNNEQGRAEMEAKVKERIKTLKGLPAWM